MEKIEIKHLNPLQKYIISRRCVIKIQELKATVNYNIEGPRIQKLIQARFNQIKWEKEPVKISISPYDEQVIELKCTIPSTIINEIKQFIKQQYKKLHILEINDIDNNLYF